jgi:hypothetical protein
MKISPYVTCVCPSCFEEIYLGECAIVSGTTGQELKAPSKGPAARMRVEPLSGRKYSLELARRKCTNTQCGYLLPHNIEAVPSLTLVVVGDTFSGKSHYIAALIHQIKSEWIGRGGFARFTCLTPEIEKIYVREYFDPLFLHKQVLPPTQVARKPTAEPLVYELVVSRSPKHPPATINLMIYDTSGEDYERMERLVGFARFVLHTSAFIFVADPVMMDDIFNELPTPLQTDLLPAYNLGRGRRAAERLNAVISLFERYRGYSSGARLPNTPVAVMVSKADLFERLALPYRYQFMMDPLYRIGLDQDDINVVDQEVKGLLDQYHQRDLLVATSRFKRVKFFATSATGEPPNAAGQFTKVKPRRCLDPMLWIMNQLGVI